MKIIPIGILVKGIRGMRKDLKLDSEGRDLGMNWKGMVPLFKSYQGNPLVYASGHTESLVDSRQVCKPGGVTQKILLLNQLGQLGSGCKFGTYPWSFFVVWSIALTKVIERL
jgi:hypothetical protein